jgi:hypothetical protein
VIERGEPLPSRVPSPEPGRESDEPVRDALTERRYAELDGWSQSASTVVMPAVSGAYPESPGRLVVAPSVPSESSGVPDPSDSAPFSSDLLVGRRRVAVLGGGGLVVALVAAGAFALAGGTDSESGSSAGSAPVSSAAAAVPDEHPVSGILPVTSAPATASPSASPSPSASASSSASVPARAARPVLTFGHGKLLPTTAAPTRSPEPDLSAHYRYGLDDSGYRGVIKVVNSGDAAASDWTVTLNVPGEEVVSVTSGPVSMSQSGSNVTFLPAGGPVAAGASVSFGFALDGVPASLPDGCTIDGAPCS